MTIELGKKAPNFTVMSDAGKEVTLADFKGKNVILYFYPKDNTPGCTQESCDFRDAVHKFARFNTVVVGVSRDNEKSHTTFKERYRLPFTLLADVNAELCEAFGVLQPKNMFGKSYMGIDRSTFLIDEEGIVRGAWRGVKITGHVKELLDIVSENQQAKSEA